MRLGIDLGGTKTEILALDPDGSVRLRRRVPSVPDYDGTLALVAGLVRQAEAEMGARGSVGIAIPGAEGAGALIKNANSVWLNGRAFRADLEAALGRDVRLANDANCFALSEARDGAGLGAAVMFGVIAGTGLGGGIAVKGDVLMGAHGVAGEWGHIPLPGMTADERAEAPECYCGRRGCMEVWCSGPGLEKDFARHAGRKWAAVDIAASAGPDAMAAMDRFMDRFARGLAVVVNLLDPDAIVLGGGLSNVARLYDDLPPLVERHAFNPQARPRIVKNRHGDSSGVRGAAWLWPESET